jgi:hypothetical protein
MEMISMKITGTVISCIDGTPRSAEITELRPGKKGGTFGKLAGTTYNVFQREGKTEWYEVTSSEAFTIDTYGWE